MYHFTLAPVCCAPPSKIRGEVAHVLDFRGRVLSLDAGGDIGTPKEDGEWGGAIEFSENRMPKEPPGSIPYISRNLNRSIRHKTSVEVFTTLTPVKLTKVP